MSVIVLVLVLFWCRNIMQPPNCFLYYIYIYDLTKNIDDLLFKIIVN
jgi:hypothetical protein